MNDFVSIASFATPYEYTVLKLLLEKKGIRFRFQNESLTGADPFYSLPHGAIVLKVHREDLPAAKKILKEFD